MHVEFGQKAGCRTVILNGKSNFSDLFNSGEDVQVACRLPCYLASPAESLSVLVQHNPDQNTRSSATSKRNPIAFIREDTSRWYFLAFWSWGLLDNHSKSCDFSPHNKTLNMNTIFGFSF